MTGGAARRVRAGVERVVGFERVAGFERVVGSEEGASVEGAWRGGRVGGMPFVAGVEGMAEGRGVSVDEGATGVVDVGEVGATFLVSGVEGGCSSTDLATSSADT